MKISLVIPAYNEEKTIANTIGAYKKFFENRKWDYEIIAVNDGSCDSTLEQIQNNDDVVCISYEKNRGKGYAVKRGVLRATGDYIFFSDADLSYSPENISLALQKLKEGVNIVVGERIDRNKKYSVMRRIASYMLNVLLRLILGIDTTDSQCGFKGFDKKTAKELFSRLECEDFGFDFELLCIADNLKKKRLSISVEFTHHKNSKVNIIYDSLKIIKRIMCLRPEMTPKKRRQTAFWTVFFLLAMFRLSYQGYNYTPYLDDYVQYTLYPSVNQPWERVLTGGAGILFTRPLAGLADFYIWSRFDDALGIAVLILSVIYALSAVLFYKTFNDINIGVTPAFLVFFVFCPINIEGTYWLSASSRIVVSLFLTALSCRLLIKEKIRLFWLCNAAAMCFYEQITVLAFIIPIIICLAKRRLRTATIPLLNLFAICGYYIIFGGMSNNSGRINLSLAGIFDRIKQLISESYEMWGRAQRELIVNGVSRGLRQIISDNAFVWLLILVVLVSALSVLIKDGRHKKIDSISKILLGLFIALISMAPFLISSGHMNFRNAVPTLLGVALVLDGIVWVLFKKTAPYILGICAMCFIVVSVSEVCDYDLTARRDMELIENVAANIPPQYETELEEVVCSCSAPVRFEQNTVFNDHIISIRGSDWGITGAVKAMIYKQKNRL